VLWTNVGRNQHYVQPSEPDAFEGVATDDFAPGQSYSVTFDDPGDYPYYCSIHGTKKGSGQTGVIRVVAPEGS
jgi:plastocyanin